MRIHLDVQRYPQGNQGAHSAPHERQPDLVLLLQPLTRTNKSLRNVVAIVLSESILSGKSIKGNPLVSI